MNPDCSGRTRPARRRILLPCPSTASVNATDPAYLLKEQLREVFTTKGATGKQLLAGWLSWATRSRLPEFVALAKTIKKYLSLIHNTLEHGVSNALSEATNTHLRLLTRRAYGYHSADALIAMATLTRGGPCPTLPGRS